MRVPADVAVVGYDNNDVSLGVFPSLTTVDNKFEELGKCLATELLGLIDGRVKFIRSKTGSKTEGKRLFLSYLARNSSVAANSA